MKSIEFLLISIFIFVFCLVIFHKFDTQDYHEFDKLEELLNHAERLERILKFEKEQLKKYKADIDVANRNIYKKYEKIDNKIHNNLWLEPIPVLVFSCNRATAVRDHVTNLIKYRPSKEQFPIIVSQDCDNEDVKNEVLKFGDNVTYIKHTSGEKANIVIPKEHLTYTSYYRIARHYKLALNYVFKEKGYSSVIITEDDLSFSSDFFSYFSSTRYLLEKDHTLWCVTAWNDNGKENTVDFSSPEKLYRSDFFAGLGWMTTSDIWAELEPIWPVSFWDDWLREPERRKNRQCIRPEVSRTGMTNYGKVGASKGLFFSKHLIKIKVNQSPVDFRRIDLDYLLPENFERMFNNDVFNKSNVIDIKNLQTFLLDPMNKGKSIRIYYSGNIDYVRKADALHIMHDFKAGVPRTAYNGIVTSFINGVRVYLVPDRMKVSGYDKTWNVPPNYGE